MIHEEMDFTNKRMLRQEAEKKLKEKQEKELKEKQEKELKEKQEKEHTQVNETDLKRLLHELQVHQVELEMQNDELRQAYETAETALKKYTILYDFAPMAYFTLNADGSIDELNFTAAELLGDKRISLINSNFKLFVYEDSKTTFNNFFNKLYKGTAKKSCQVMLGYDDKPPCKVYIEGVLTGDKGKCLLSVIDISSIK